MKIVLNSYKSCREKKCVAQRNSAFPNVQMLGFERYGKGIWETVSKSAGEFGLATIVQKEGEILSYEITNPGKLDQTYWNQAVTQLTVASALGAGLPWLDAIMSGGARGNFKVMWNSPNELNPNRLKAVTPIRGAVSQKLIGSLADTTGSDVLAHAGGVLNTPSGRQLALPATGSLSLYEAELWQKTWLGEIDNLINKNASLEAQAAQAVALATDIVMTGRNAMADALAATQLGITTPVRSLSEILRKFGKDCSGDYLYRKVISDVKEIFGFRHELTGDACFMAGTLVHTKEGLLPIEQIKVGDWVLSQPEEKGELAYKRVVRTMEFEDTPVHYLRYYKTQRVIEDGKEKYLYLGPDTHNTLIGTGNHPFWVVGYDLDSYYLDEPGPGGWTRADKLSNGCILELANGDLVKVSRSDHLWRTATDGVGWTELSRDSERGYRVDLREGSFNHATGLERSVKTDFANEGDFFRRHESEESIEHWSFKCTVYNFEVEDFHTYYVGEFGVWVHNNTCGGTFFENPNNKPTREGTGKGVLRSPATEIYYTQKDLEDAIAKMGDDIHGFVLVYENIAGQTQYAWVKFQDGVEGGQRSADGLFFLAHTLIYKNPAARGIDYIRLGDGIAYIRENGELKLSKTTIDSKGWNAYKGLNTEKMDSHKLNQRQNSPDHGAHCSFVGF